MQLWRPWIVLGVLAAVAAPAAVVYKWTDADGVVHYSDQSIPGAEKIYTTSSAANPSVPAGRPAVAPTAKTPTSGLQFERLTISSPNAEETFFGDEVINVGLTVEPALKDNQIVTWHLNGRQLENQGPADTHFSLQSLSRGTYAIAATVTDQGTGETQSTDSVTFYVRQPSALSPQHKAP
jgi:Domain of unknown function (DUF4124)